MAQTTNAGPQAGAVSLQNLLVIALILVVLLAGGLYLWQVSRLENEVSTMAQRVEEALQVAQQALKRSESAADRAERAEDGASLAAGLRDQEVMRRREAERRAEDAEIQAQAAHEEVEAIKKRRDAEMDRLKRILGRIVDTRRTPLGLVMNLDSDFIQFEFDQSELRPRERELLSRIVGILLTSEGYRIQVFGHTDDVGSREYNQALSERRARAVRDYLVEAGLDPSIISTKGLGKSQPLVEGVDEQARAKNRRVEIAVVDAVVNYEEALEDPWH